ncbi:MAG: peptidylprolyl isomerase [Elusimicrobiota bacterium]
MKSINSIFLMLFASSSLFSQVKEDIVAKINGEAVLRSEFDKAKQMIIEQYAEFSPQTLKEDRWEDKVNKMAFEKIVGEVLIKQESAKLNVKVTEREIENGANEVKSRFSYDVKGNRLSNAEAEKAFFDELKKQNMTYEEFKAKIKRDLMARKLVDQLIKPKIAPPSESELKLFFDKVMLVMNGTETLKTNESDMEDYAAIASKFKEVFSERIRLKHILIKFDKSDIVSKNQALEKAKNIRNRIINGEDFDDIAIKESDDSDSAKRGGDIGYVIKGMLPQELEKTAFSINLGEISNPIETDFGYHIICVTEKKIAQKVRFDMVKDELANIMMQKKFAEEVEKYVKELKKKAKIEIFDSKIEKK